MSTDTGKVNIHGKEYETVASRVQRFREKYVGGDNKLPILAIETEIIDRTAEDVVVKATIKTVHDGLIIATGFAEERRASSSINRTSALENAETSAIGRALANFGMAGTEYASADEVAGAIQARTVPKTTTTTFKPSRSVSVDLGGTENYKIDTAPSPATKIQKAQIAALLRGKGVKNDNMHDYVTVSYGFDLSTINVHDAADLIIRLKADPKNEVVAEDEA